jgi:hypothetical protein
MLTRQVVLGTFKFTQQSYLCQNLAPLRFRSLLERVESCKAPDSEQIPAELIQTGGGGGTSHSEIRKLIRLIWNNEELPHQWKESIVVPVHKKGERVTAVSLIIEANQCSQLHTKFYLPFFSLG